MSKNIHILLNSMKDVDLSLELQNVQNSKELSNQVDPVIFCHSAPG